MSDFEMMIMSTDMTWNTGIWTYYSHCMVIVNTVNIYILNQICLYK